MSLHLAELTGGAVRRNSFGGGLATSCEDAEERRFLSLQLPPLRTIISSNIDQHSNAHANDASVSHEPQHHRSGGDVLPSLSSIINRDGSPGVNTTNGRVACGSVKPLDNLGSGGETKSQPNSSVSSDSHQRHQPPPPQNDAEGKGNVAENDGEQDEKKPVVVLPSLR
ncbi:hypothetical protein HK102_008222, partial [Quaeritorhiza haematococci]